MTMVFHHHGMEEESGRGMEGDEIVGKKRGGGKNYDAQRIKVEVDL